MKKPPSSFTITFPSLTAKELIEQCGNKTSDGNPLLWSIDWYKNRDFYTTEKCRPGKRSVNFDLKHKGSSWKKTTELLKESGEEMLSFPELLYAVYWYEKTYGKMPPDLVNGYSWTSSPSVGGDFVVFGSAGAEGAYVSRREPGDAWAGLGAVFSRSGSGDMDTETLNPREARTGRSDLPDELVVNGVKYRKI